MAPALTEPLSPNENLSNSTGTASTTPTTRSSRKLDTSIANKRSAPITREKRIRCGGIINQTPSSSKRETRLRDNLQRNSLTSQTSVNCDNTSESQPIVLKKEISKVTNAQELDCSLSSSKNTNCLEAKNEQMGLSAVPLNNKTNTSFDTIDDNTKDSSTEQLLADLTNEAITAEICLRNQLKDVNLVKTSGDLSSPIIQQHTFADRDSDIVVFKVAPPAAATPEVNITSSAHMEAQFNETKSSNILDIAPSKEEEGATSIQTLVEDIDSTKVERDSFEQKETLEKEVLTEKCLHNDDAQKKQKSNETLASQNYMEPTTISLHISSDDVAETKKTVPKLEVLSLQELPPVSTDSTMTASEVEDNLEERLSQLDGTAIDSPPPNNSNIDSNEKNSENDLADATPPHTPTHQQTLCNELVELQQQLQHTPPTPVAEQVQANTSQIQQQLQTNCFSTPQSTTSSSINLLGNVSSGNMSQSYIKESDNVGGSAELEDQDIEEVFKVLKGFEGGTSSDLNVCDLNVLFNEVYMKINETELSGNAGSGGSIASGISSNTHSHIAVSSPSIQLVKPTEMEEVQMEIGKRQLQMHRKIDFLMRRLRKLQARYMCKHTSEEIAGLFEWSARQASKGVTNTTCLQNNENNGTQDTSRCFLKVIAARPPASDWKDVHETLVPANQITTLLRKIESVASAQQLCTTPAACLVNATNKKNKRAQAATTATNSSTVGTSLYIDSKAEEVIVATLDENITDELTQVAGLLHIEMSEVQKAMDSDATESSSGGESADEMVTYNNTQQQTLPITKRAAWRYSRDRAAIASRWSWLLSQISDLEIKIRQHSELHQEIVRSKGLVTCDSQIETTEQVSEELMGSCRTRGYIPSLFRKRKLIQTTNIHTISKKAARPSTIKCGCQWPLHPCALCTGRLDPTAPRDLPDTMMMSDRIALLDSGYHPVLSFRENINNALHFEAIAKQPDWQQRVMRCQAKSIAKNVWRAEREAVAAAAGGNHNSSSKKYSETPPTKRRYIKKKDKFNNDEKTGGKISNSTSGTQEYDIATVTSVATLTSVVTSLSSTALSHDLGNGTSILSTTTPPTPLVANKGISKGVKKLRWPLAKEEILSSLVTQKSLNASSFTSTTPSPATTAATTPNKTYIHQTSDCLPTNYDQFNPNQIPSSLISNNHNSSKSNKHRKISSSVVNSHHYNHPNNTSNLYNGDSSCIISHEYWGGAGESFNVRSRTSSPTHGSSGSIYQKYERSLDRKNRTSYDIDNIVIPYSVAAATRVEVLPYKEIPTPKWRVIDNENQEIKVETLDATHVTNGHVCDIALESVTVKHNHIESDKIPEVHSKDVNKDWIEEKTTSNSSKENDIKSDKRTECNVQIVKGDKTDNESSLTDNASDNRLLGQQVKDKDKYLSLSNATIKKVDDDEASKEPERKKLKIDAVRMDVKSYKPEKEVTEKEYNEEKITMQNGLKIISEDEDISDDAMFLRHEKALTEERRKFQTYLKFPWSTRSRANRRIDSRAESSGANTPDPSSPAPQTPSVGGGDLESIPSPLNPATPLNPLDAFSEAGDNSTSFLGINSLPSLSSKHYERRRTTSTKREVERRSSTPDSKEIVPPYEPLTFPLTDEQFEELMRVMPSEHGEESKRFDECYLPGGSGGGIVILGGISSNKCSRTVSGSTSKRSSRASTLCGETMTAGAGGRRTKNSNCKNLRKNSADESNGDDLLLYDDDYEDDYPKHHLAPNDDHLTADSVGVGNFTACDSLYVDDDDDVYGDQYGAYVGRRQSRKHCDADSEDDTSEEEPFQDDDPNDPEWRGETEERLRKKI